MQSASVGKTRKKKPSRGRKRHRRYSKEFQAHAVQLAVRGDKTVKAVADDLDVAAGTLYHWVRRAEAEVGHAAAVGETAEEQIVRLEKRVALLEEEREILKKAATFFAKESE